MSDYMTAKEKARHVAEWQALLASPFDATAPGTPDPEIVPLVNALNAIDGVCVVQSCAGHRAPERKADGMSVRPGLLWLRLNRATMQAFLGNARACAELPSIEGVTLRYGRYDGAVLELLFKGADTDALRDVFVTLPEFFAALRQGEQ